MSGVPEWAQLDGCNFHSLGLGVRVQRLVARAVQVSNAQCMLSALSRVGVGVAALSSSLSASVFLSGAGRAPS